MQRAHGFKRRYAVGLALVAGGLVGCVGATPPAWSEAGSPLPCAGVERGQTSAGLYFECTGAGAEVVILIPAFSMDRRMWESQVALLRGEARVIAYDLRAHGKSAAAAAPYSAIDDLLGLMNELGVRRAHLIGLSNGARVALDFALSQPTRVRSLVLASPGLSGYVNREPMTWMTPVINAARSGDVAQAADLWAATALMRIPNDSGAAARILQMSRDNRSLWGYATNPERPLNPPAIGRLAEIKIPVLVVMGQNDLSELRTLADTVARGIAGAQLVVIPDAGHMVNLAAPAQFNDAIRSFLRQASRSGEAPDAARRR